MEQPSSPKRFYSFIEVLYRNGQKEQFPPDLKLQADGVNLWASDSQGPLYVRALSRIAGIAAVEVAA
jgi:hypothetical protein